MGDPNHKLRRKYLRKETRELALHVLQKCIEEKNAGRFFHPVSQPMERAEYYSGISKQRLSMITKVAESELPNPPFINEPKALKHEFLHAKDFDRSVIHECLQEAYFSKGKLPFSGPKILAALQERTYFPWGMETFRKLLKEIGYQYQKNGTRHYLIEKPAITNARSKYLKSARQYRQQGRHIFLLFLTYFESKIGLKLLKTNHQQAYYIDPKNMLILVLSGKGDSFLNGTNLFWKTSQTADDSNDNDNDDGQVATKDTIEEWLASVVIPNMPTNSVIIMDNSSHILQKCKIPPRAGSRSEFSNWLKQHRIEFTPDITRKELFKLIKSSRENFELDSIIQKNGHEVITLPEFMFDLKPIDKTWAKVKRVITEHRTNPDICKQGFDYVVESAIAKVRQIVEEGCQYLDNIAKVKEEIQKDADGETSESDPLHLGFVKAERESSDVKVKEEIKDEETDNYAVSDSEMPIKMEFKSE